MKLEPVEVRNVDQFDQAFATIKTVRAEALILIADRFLLTHRARIAEATVKNGLPGIFPFAEFAHEGGLMSYAPNYPEMYRRAATFVDKIVRGTKPGDLPVEQPTTFELVVNLKTAKALGLAIAPSLLVRADHVIQ
jgi:putative ABC transport system substrate-binding protein